MINNIENPEFKVFVRCMTYNQSKYIVETMNGFTMQQTDFPFVCCIVDDSSTDGEQDIILKYLNKYFDMSAASGSYTEETDYAYIFFAQHKENKNCYFSVLFLKENLYSKKEEYKKFSYMSRWRNSCKYEAICEGDDYWVDCEKIKRQAHFLDNNSNYSMVASNSYLITEEGQNEGILFSTLPSRKITTMQELIEGRKFHTASVLLRLELWKKSRITKLHKTWDTFLWCSLLEFKPIYYSNQITCVYRRGNQGVVQGTNKFNWLMITSEWSDILIEQFSPKYISREIISRFKTNDLLLGIFLNFCTFSYNQKKILWKEYVDSFYWCNIASNIRNVFKIILILILRSIMPTRVKNIVKKHLTFS